MKRNCIFADEPRWKETIGANIVEEAACINYVRILLHLMSIGELHAIF